MVRMMALGAVIGLSLTAQPIAQRPPSTDVPVAVPDISLSSCWQVAEGIPAELSTYCVGHRRGVLAAWRNHGSYYALLEIVENRFGDPEQQGEKLRREEVLGLLGTEHLEDYPNSRSRNLLAWSSDRALPAGGHLLVFFDRSDRVQSYDWVSE